MKRSFLLLCAMELHTPDGLVSAEAGDVMVTDGSQIAIYPPSSFSIMALVEIVSQHGAVLGESGEALQAIRAAQ